MDPKSATPNSTGILPPRGYALSGKIMLAAIVVLFTVVLFILFLHLYVRYRVYRRRSRRHRRRQRLIFAAASAAADDHRAGSCGLDPSVLRSLPVSVVSLAEDGDEDDDVAAECAVCLCEFLDGEKVRVLARCGHRFHVDCIDMWFCSHSSCPLCRSPVEVDPAKSAPPFSRCADPEAGAGSSSESDPDPNPEASAAIGNREEAESGFGSRIYSILRFFVRDSAPIRDLERGEAAAPSPAAAA